MPVDLSKSFARGSSPSASQTGPFDPPLRFCPRASSALPMLLTQHLLDLTDIAIGRCISVHTPVFTASSDLLLEHSISWTFLLQLKGIVEAGRDVGHHPVPLRKVFHQAACCSLHRPLARQPPSQQHQEDALNRPMWRRVRPGSALGMVTMEQL